MNTATNYIPLIAAIVGVFLTLIFTIIGYFIVRYVKNNDNALKTLFRLNAENKKSIEDKDKKDQLHFTTLATNQNDLKKSQDEFHKKFAYYFENINLFNKNCDNLHIGIKVKLEDHDLRIEKLENEKTNK